MNSFPRIAQHRLAPTSYARLVLASLGCLFLSGCTLFFDSDVSSERFSDDCVPECRDGFLCNDGECVETCNPPCADGETCAAGSCVADETPDAGPDTEPDADVGTDTDEDADARVEDVTLDADATDPDADATDPDAAPDVDEDADTAQPDADVELNECGGESVLAATVGEPCGVCDSGSWACATADSLGCEGDAGDGARNLCGGCAELEAAPDDACGVCGTGVWLCDGDDALSCDGDQGDEALNACGGCAELVGELDDPCGTCDSGTWACDGADALDCEGDGGELLLNECGGCAALEAAPETACGTCGSGEWACLDAESVGCQGDDGDEALNPCGGCEALDAAPGESCGPCLRDEIICTSEESTTCDGFSTGNECGGCLELAPALGTSCGPCGLDGYVCGTDLDVPVCSGITFGNACDGCGELENPVGSACGTCDSGAYVCAGPNDTTCAGDRGDLALNTCGTCGDLDGEPGAPCRPCSGGVWECSDGAAICDADLCETGESCFEDFDCEVGVCSNGVCAPDGFVHIAGGSFVMGSPDGTIPNPMTAVVESEESGRTAYERQRIVHIDSPFFLMETEVTQAEFLDRSIWPADIALANPSAHECANCPVDGVSQWDIYEYANALSEAEGLEPCYTMALCRNTIGLNRVCHSASIPRRDLNVLSCTGYRLPTEAEWEFAARAGVTSGAPLGEIALTTDTCAPEPAIGDHGWHCGNVVASQEVGTSIPNAFGLYDMLGNVAEVVHDGWEVYPEREHTDPYGSGHLGANVVRGGSWGSFPRDLRYAWRTLLLSGHATTGNGFRLARSVAPTHCDDYEQNGDETDVDCGGSCAPCYCFNGIADDSPALEFPETDVDCGGPCRPCVSWQGCDVDEDCKFNGVCTEGVCLPCFNREFGGMAYSFCGSETSEGTFVHERCGTIGARVAEPRTAAINDFFYENTSPTFYQFWRIGITDVEEEGVWRYLSDGGLLDFSGWNSGTAPESTDHNCAVMYGQIGTWTHLECSRHASFICERELP